MTMSPQPPDPHSQPAAPQTAYSTPMYEAPAAPPSLPTYCLIMFVVSLFFAVVRIPVVGLSIFGASTLDADDPLLATAWGEIGSGIGIVVLGLFANIVLLLKQRWGLVPALGLVLMVVASVIVSLVQLPIMLEQGQQQGPERVGFIMGAMVAMLFRLVLLGAYIGALWRFHHWSQSTMDASASAAHQGDNWAV